MVDFSHGSHLVPVNCRPEEALPFLRLGWNFCFVELPDGLNLGVAAWLGVARLLLKCPGSLGVFSPELSSDSSGRIILYST